MTKGAANQILPLVKFDSSESRGEFVRFHQSIPERHGIWAFKNMSMEDRVKDKALFKIKRAICEISGCDGSLIIIDKPSKIVYRVSADGSLTEVVHASSNTTNNWNARVEKPIKDAAQQVLASE